MEYRRKISIRTLLALVLEKWRIILLAGLLLGGALGFRKASILWPETKPQQEAEVQPEISDTESVAEPVEEEKAESISAYEQELKLINEQITAMQDYMLHSVLANVNFSDEDQAAADIYVDVTNARLAADTAAADGAAVSASNESIEQTANALLKVLYRFASVGVDWTELTEETGLNASLLKESVWASGLDQVSYTFTITARGRSAEEAEKIVNTVVSQLKELDWSDTADPSLYTVAVRGFNTYKAVDSSNFSWHRNRINELNNLLSAKDTYQTAINKNRSNTAVVKATTNKQKKVMSRKTVLKSCLKHTAAGFVVGAGGVMFLYALFLMLSGRVLSAQEFNSTYRLRKLAVLPSEKKNKGIDRLVSRIDSGAAAAGSIPVCLKIACENIANEAGKERKILLTGDLPAASLQQLAAALSEQDRRGMHIETASDLNGDPEALRKLEEADCVMLAAGIRKSLYSENDEIISTVNAYRKKILGSIVVR
ncbi:MAG: hypothetical protein Q4B09_04080 [Lachnospiraceae bacterium]|nr:hypothetical protein [Lachnospiraceae bacterium]